jgi:hypothetical protein
MLRLKLNNLFHYKYKHLVVFLLVTIVVNGCAFAPWEKSAVVGKTPEERSASAKKESIAKPDASDSA